MRPLDGRVKINDVCYSGVFPIRIFFVFVFFFFFKQKTAYEIYQCDWSSDVCSSDLHDVRYVKAFALGIATASRGADHLRNRPTLEMFLKLPMELKEKIYGQGVNNDPTSYDLKEKSVYFSDNIFAVIDSLGICKFICHGFNSPNFVDYGWMKRLIFASTGLEIDEKELANIGARVIDNERLIKIGRASCRERV